MTFLETINIDVLVLAIFCLINFGLAVSSLFKLNRMRSVNRGLRKRVHDLEDDVKALYNTTSNIGEHLKVVQHHNKILKEQQEQLTLKEPSQQSYRNALQQLRNGESISKIAETSGLSKGELELLRLLKSGQSAEQSIEDPK